MDCECFCCGDLADVAEINAASQGEGCRYQLDVDLALSELDSLQLSTGRNCSKGSGADRGERAANHGYKLPRERSLSESTSVSTHRLIRSCSESSFDSQSKKQSALNNVRIENSSSKKFSTDGQNSVGGGYQLVRRNSEFVSNIGMPYSRSSLCHWSSLPASWSYGENSGLNSGWYRDCDLQDRGQRRAARLRLERSRRLRRPYLIPFRMCQSMHDEGATSLADFWATPSSPSTAASKSNTTSPVKQQGDENAQGQSKLVRSHSVDNLELAKLKLSDLYSGQLELAREHQAVEQVATGLQNLQMV